MRANQTFLLMIALSICFSQDALSDEGPMVEVRGAKANITLNENGRTVVVGTVNKGTKLWALETKGEFYRVIEPATLRAGWIWNKHATPIVYSKQDNETAVASIKAKDEMVDALIATDYVRAVRAGHEALQLGGDRLRDNHPGMAITIYTLGIVYQHAAEYSNAETQLDRALRMQKLRLGPDHFRTLKTLRQLGILYYLQGDVKASEETLFNVVSLSRRSNTVDRRELSDALIVLGNNYCKSDKWTEAEKVLRESLAIRKELLGKDNVLTGEAMGILGTVCLNLGKALEAETLLARALEISRKEHDPDHRQIAIESKRLANLYETLGDYGRSRILFEQALAIHEKSSGPEHIDTASALQSLAAHHTTVGNHTIAETLANRALSIDQKTLGPAHPRVAIALGLLGAIYSRQGEHEKAESVIKKALAISENANGPTHTSTAIRHYALGAFYFRKADYVNARISFERALQILNEFEVSFYGESLSYLGRTFAHLDDLSKANELLKKAIDLNSKAIGKEHPTTLLDVSTLSALNAHSGDITTAIQLQDQCQHGMRKHFVQILPTMSEYARTSYLESGFADSLHLALSLAQVDHTNSRTATISAGWLLNAKAMGQEASAESALLAAPEAVEQVRELRDVRSQLAKLTLRNAEEVDGATRQRLAELETRQQQLQQQISAHGLGVSESEPWITTGRLMGKIPFDSVLINIARFRRFKFGAVQQKEEDQWDPEMYAAWIVPPAGAGEVHVIELGDAGTIDRYIAALRTNFDSTVLTRLEEHGEQQIEEEYRQRAKALSQLIFAPLEPHLSDVRELILSPDGQLWTVPWEALRTKNDKYVIEEFETRYVLSGRELVYDLPERGLIGPPVIFADPNYDMSGSRLLTNETHNRHPLRSAANMQFPRLKQTAVEAMAIKPQLESFTNSSARVLMQDEAQEATFKELHRPRVLVLSTHGYFQSAKQDSPDGRDETTQDVASTHGYFEPDTTIANPLLRCGLALAGANNRQQAAAEGKEDGILTGLEIVGTDLRGTELVVLSACETGLGDITSGEGVAGLRQAFQLAGAQSVVSSLWQVEDGATAHLMNEFFDNLAIGMNKSEALRQAQLTRIKSRRERNGAAHPFFWAAFTLTGQN